MKCEENAVAIARMKDPFCKLVSLSLSPSPSPFFVPLLPPHKTSILLAGVCRSCFNAYVTHRFRATIGKSRLIRDGEKACYP